MFVTHDHDVIDEVATRIWHCKGGHVEDFKGPYEEFVAQQAANAATAGQGGKVAAKSKR